MAEELPGLPAEVPGELREELGRLQGQLRVLLSNHQVLTGRLERRPEDPVILKQLGEVKRYLIVFSNQQNVALGRVRTLLSNLAEERRSRPRPLGPPPTPTKPPKARKKAIAHRKSRDSVAPSLLSSLRPSPPPPPTRTVSTPASASPTSPPAPVTAGGTSRSTP